MNVKWNGRQYSLEKFTNLHWSNFIQLQEYQLHINFQLPTEHTGVGYLEVDIIHFIPDLLRAALDNICSDQAGMRSNFEASVECILSVCPYTKHKSSSQKGPHTTISDITSRCKNSGATGVDLRWHTYKEYATFSPEQKKEQKNELYKW